MLQAECMSCGTLYRPDLCAWSCPACGSAVHIHCGEQAVFEQSAGNKSTAAAWVGYSLWHGHHESR